MFDEQTLSYFKYGTENEINATATLVSKILPSLYPHKSYVEEGYYVNPANEQPFFMVSPDGSVRHSPDEHSELGLEFKCPIPGKMFVPDVYYTFPVRYVIQVLSINITLLLLCWTKESSTLFKVQYDAELWHEILRICVNIYCGENVRRPSKVQDHNLKARLSTFVEHNTRLLAEVKSVSASPCSHLNSSENATGFKHFFTHSCRDDQSMSNLNYSVQSACNTYYNLKNGIKDAHEKTKNGCTEILVWVVSDLNRHYNPEKAHALPVAYGLKGYSLSTQILRNMHVEMIMELHRKGI